MKHWNKHFGWFLLAFALFWIIRLVHLTILPVFADEAIYIRWAQMISNDPKQYTFLPLYDGKTPLYMWILSIFLPLARAYPVWMGRFVSVLSGFATSIVLVLITRKLRGGRVSQIATFSLYLILPFTFFHDRMALTDTLFTFFLATTFLLLMKLKTIQKWSWVVAAGLVFGLSLLTKLPGLLFILQFLLILWFIPPHLSSKKQQRVAILFGFVFMIGSLIFYSLRISELFPFLFQRGADFTFSISDYCKGDPCKLNLSPLFTNLSRFFRWQAWYSTIGVLGLLIAPFVSKGWHKKRELRLILVLILVTLSMGGYYVVAGKILYSRYFLPTVIFLIPACALSIEYFWNGGRRWVVGIGASVVLIQSIWFIYPLISQVEQAHFDIEDQKQYLTEWSAGFGNRETAEYLKEMAHERPVSVATEGYFGTLPDGLSIYFDNSLLNESVEIFGIGQPVVKLDQNVLKKAQTRDTFLLVNEYRLDMDISLCCEVVKRFPRPYNGSDLLLIKINSI